MSIGFSDGANLLPVGQVVETCYIKLFEVRRIVSTSSNAGSLEI